MTSTTQNFIEQLEQSGKIPLFEIERFHNDYDVWDISITENGWIRANNGIDTMAVRIDSCFSLDEHLQELYQKCEQASQKDAQSDALHEVKTHPTFYQYNTINRIGYDGLLIRLCYHPISRKWCNNGEYCLDKTNYDAIKGTLVHCPDYDESIVFEYQDSFVVNINKAGVDTLSTILKIMDDLSNYPILDDDSFSQMESDLAFDDWQELSRDERVDFIRADIGASESYTYTEVKSHILGESMPDCWLESWRES